MRDSFQRNSRQRPSNRRFGSASAPARRGGDGNNGVAGAKRQYERYRALAQAALLSGDTVEAQNWYQHAEHYYRVMTGQQT